MALKCNNPVVPGKKICWRHAEMRRASNARYILERRRQDSEKSIEDQRTIKAKERAYNANYKNERRKMFKANGMCAQCGKVPPMHNLVLCFKCHEVNNRNSRDVRRRRKEALKITTDKVLLEQQPYIQDEIEHVGIANQDGKGEDVAMSDAKNEE
ncbi:hypothetical protein F5Y03DRAFT_395082 [Xylaria venustula]|nr:hypothetical protein F5Y03DRAFT_395082 [Xylaria venustula]